MKKWNKKNNYVRKWYGKTLHIFCPIYRSNFYYIKAKTNENFRKIMQKKFCIVDEKPDADGRFIVLEQNKTPIGIIWAVDEINLAHEVMHAVFWVAKERGLELSFESEEAFCYLHTFLMQAILNKGADNG